MFIKSQYTNLDTGSKLMPASKKAPKIALIALIISALALGTTSVAVITVNQNVGSSGSITTSPNLGIYSDSACSQSMYSITWGAVSAGGTATQTIYIKNTGTGALTISMSASSWFPSSASNYLTITMDKQGTTLSAGQQTTAILTLTVSPSITGITTFSNTISFVGTA